jgi:hypothetical protein
VLVSFAFRPIRERQVDILNWVSLVLLDLYEMPRDSARKHEDATTGLADESTLLLAACWSLGLGQQVPELTDFRDDN